MQDPTVEINPAFRGALVPADLFKTEGTIAFSVPAQILMHDHVIFRVICDDFVFVMSFQNNSVVIQRNSIASVLNANEFVAHSELIRIVSSWSLTELALGCRTSEDNLKYSNIPTPPVAPPVELLKWARKQNLLGTTIYNSEEEMREKVYSCLVSINAKVAEANAYKSFWNIEYDGNMIVSREPKREVEIQPLIHCLLSDQMLLNNIEVVPEYVTGSGNIDFLLIGYVKDIGTSKMCLEFKLAHSDKLMHGLLKQLPEYMTISNAKYGAYCILTFKGKWFDKPTLEGRQDILWHLNMMERKHDVQSSDHIRSIVIDLSKPKSASKI